MSQSDTFIDEVTEEVRRDRLFALMRKYLWVPVLLVLLIVGGAAWNEWQKAQAQTRARAFGDALIAANAAEDKLAALAAVPADGDQRAVLALLSAAAALGATDRDAAVGQLTALAADATVPPIYRQLAKLKAVILAGDTMPAPDRTAALAELATPGAPFRALALEQQALALLAAGETAPAIAALRSLLQEAGLTPGLQARATQLIVALGEDPNAAS